MRDAGTTEQINRIPDAVLAENSIEQGWENHRDAAGDATFDPGTHRIGFNW